MRADLGNHEFIEELVKTKVSNYTVKNGCEEGDNVAGSLKKIEIQTQNGDQLNVIFKIIPEVAPEWILELEIFRIEHAMYRTLIPLLKSFASSQGFNYELPTPKYFTGFNDDKNDYICLQDIRPLGFIMSDKSKSLQLTEMKLIMRELAKFHAVSYALIVKQGDQIFDNGDMKYFAKLTDPNGVNEIMFRTIIEAYYTETTEIMKKRRPEVGKRMESIVPNIWKIWKSTKTNKSYVQTIIHSDLWTNNLLIKYVNEDPSDVQFIDFQFVQRGNILSDLQYLIFTSTTPEFRKDHLFTILNCYLDHFSSTLEFLKCTPPQLTRGDLVNQFYECYLPGFIHMTFAIPLQLGYLGPDTTTEDNKNNQGESTWDMNDDMTSDISRQYLKSPLALSRLDALADEMIQMNII